MKSKKIWFIVGALAVILLAVIGYWRLCVDCIHLDGLKDAILAFIQGFGPWAIIVYILLYTVNTVTLFPPIAIMSLSAGALFGPVWGTVALTTGAFCGTTVTFVISRFFRGKWVDRFVKGKAAAFNEKLNRRGFVVLLPMRLIGFPPYEFVNYASGLSKVSYKDYISATMLGMSPAIIIQVLLADRLAHFSWKDPVLYVVVVLFIGMGIMTGKIIKKQQAAVKAEGETGDVPAAGGE